MNSKLMDDVFLRYAGCERGTTAQLSNASVNGSYLDKIEEENSLNDFLTNIVKDNENNKISMIERENQELRAEISEIKLILKGIGMCFGAVNPLTPEEDILKEWKRFIKKRFTRSARNPSREIGILDLLD